jgi:galactose oxidase-like protein
VLVAGGETVPSDPTDTEIWDPTTGTWSLVGALIQGRHFHTATLLPGGKVLVTGGYLANGAAIVYRECEIFDPATGIWSQTGELATGRYQFTATLLPDGKVLAAGGTGENLANLASAEIYDSATGSWSPTGSLNLARNNHAASLLDSGMVLVEGGYDGTAMDKTSAELYDPGTTTEATTVNGTGFVPAGGGIARFTLRASLSGDRASGTLTYHDVGTDIAIQKAKVRTLTFTGNSADLTGNARLGDGTKVTYSVTVTDGSSDGSSDTFNITLSNGYSAGGVVTNGDISFQ